MQLHVVPNNPEGIKWLTLQNKHFLSLATCSTGNIKLHLNQVGSKYKGWKNQAQDGFQLWGLMKEIFNLQVVGLLQVGFLIGLISILFACLLGSHRGNHKDILPNVRP
jgi:hypothetical protein